MLKAITVGELKKNIELFKISDESEINFLFREDLFNDEGKDYRYIPTSVFCESDSKESDSKKTLTLVGIAEPDIS